MKILCTQTNRNRLCDGCGDTASDNRCRACLDESRGIPDSVVGGIQNLRDYYSGIELTKMKDDIYIGKQVTDGRGQTRTIINYNPSNCEATLDKPFDVLSNEKYPLPTGAVVLAEFSIGVDIGQDRDHSVIAIANKDLQKGDLVVAPLEEGLLKSNQDIIDDMLAAIKVSPSAVYSYETFADIEPPSLSSRCASLPYIEPLYSKELPTKSGVYSVRYKIISDIYKTMEVTVERLNDISFIVKAPGLQMPLDVFCKSAWNVEWLFIRDLETQEID